MDTAAHVTPTGRSQIFPVIVKRNKTLLQRILTYWVSTMIFMAFNVFFKAVHIENGL